MATIRCGKCGQTHDSVAAVRRCYGSAQPVAARVCANGVDHRAASGSMDDINRLIEACGCRPASIFAAPAAATLPHAPRGSGRWPVVNDALPLLSELRAQMFDKAGHYAVQDGEFLRFLRVNVKTTHGSTRVYLDEQASDELYPVRDLSRQVHLLQLVLADPQAALVRYGHEIGKCGVCNRTLTDEASRAAGIGPVCASRLG